MRQSVDFISNLPQNLDHLPSIWDISTLKRPLYVAKSPLELDRVNCANSALTAVQNIEK